MLTAQEVIEQLRLAPHIEGGFFRRTYTSRETLTTTHGVVRPAMTSIYYLVTRDSPISFFARNRSDILHFFHSGSPLTYHLVRGDGQYQRFVLGPNGHGAPPATLIVSGGTWKACELEVGEFALISEVVTPGFDYEDMSLAAASDLRHALELPADWQRWIKGTAS
jgi:predicted cupin superfamily sugar epimerase